MDDYPDAWARDVYFLGVMATNNDKRVDEVAAPNSPEIDSIADAYNEMILNGEHIGLYHNHDTTTRPIGKLLLTYRNANNDMGCLCHLDGRTRLGQDVIAAASQGRLMGLSCGMTTPREITFGYGVPVSNAVGRNLREVSMTDDPDGKEITYIKTWSYEPYGVLEALAVASVPYERRMNLTEALGLGDRSRIVSKLPTQLESLPDIILSQLDEGKSFSTIHPRKPNKSGSQNMVEFFAAVSSGDQNTIGDFFVSDPTLQEAGTPSPFSPNLSPGRRVKRVYHTKHNASNLIFIDRTEGSKTPAEALVTMASVSQIQPPTTPAKEADPTQTPSNTAANQPAVTQPPTQQPANTVAPTGNPTQPAADITPTQTPKEVPSLKLKETGVSVPAIPNGNQTQLTPEQQAQRDAVGLNGLDPTQLFTDIASAPNGADEVKEMLKKNELLKARGVNTWDDLINQQKELEILRAEKAALLEQQKKDAEKKAEEERQKENLAANQRALDVVKMQLALAQKNPLFNTVMGEENMKKIVALSDPEKLAKERLSLDTIYEATNLITVASKDADQKASVQSKMEAHNRAAKNLQQAVASEVSDVLRQFNVFSGASSASSQSSNGSSQANPQVPASSSALPLNHTASNPQTTQTPTPSVSNAPRTTPEQVPYVAGISGSLPESEKLKVGNAMNYWKSFSTIASSGSAQKPLDPYARVRMMVHNMPGVDTMSYEAVCDLNRLSGNSIRMFTDASDRPSDGVQLKAVQYGGIRIV